MLAVVAVDARASAVAADATEAVTAGTLRVSGDGVTPPSLRRGPRAGVESWWLPLSPLAPLPTPASLAPMFVTSRSVRRERIVSRVIFNLPAILGLGGCRVAAPSFSKRVLLSIGGRALPGGLAGSARCPQVGAESTA